jgi:hypothetical protein
MPETEDDERNVEPFADSSLIRGSSSFTIGWTIDVVQLHRPTAIGVHTLGT